ncbi:MAG: 50S ribosome-binding GTPase, partial [Proteobacteria bacterium]|nr:50S ribosome-binding GTPase [Pseudomonadota bacterium]
MLKIEEFTKRKRLLLDGFKNDLKAISQANPKIDFAKLMATLDKQIEAAEQSNKVRIVVVGQYSAGKSSLLRMLTGREDIAVGANITTEKVQKFDWNGIEIVDTPGIHTELHPDHDEISYHAIASADLLIFVVTNELFDAHIAEHFRKLAIDSGKASEMILVINKMDRTTNGNTEAQQNTIKEDLRPVLEPYTPEQLYISFLAADSYH